MSPTLLAILRRLSDEAFISGESIARQLGCSRATVHNILREADHAGVAVHAVQGRGYRLAEPMDWLNQEALSEGLEPRGFRFHFFEALPSTNAFLLEEAASDAPHRTVAIAEWQTQGRGRRGRSWHATLGNSLAFSLLWRFPRPATELAGLSLAVGATLARELQRLGLEQARVKWPNDIVVEGAKLAGVLIELSGDMLGPSTAVIGIGLNVRGGDRLSRALELPVTDLSRHLGTMDRNTVFLGLMNALDEGLALFEREGFHAFRGDWMACHAYQGRMVDILTPRGERIPGKAMGVDEQGALLLETGSEVLRFHSGEVSLRVAGP
jgi:BirA family biotin operon repressor/biotin-[acetyl-CoA-carboxylase] ligase